MPTTDNFYATLSSAVFSDGPSFTFPGRSLPDGTRRISGSRTKHRPVRTRHRRRGQLRFLSRGLHGAQARRKSTACRGRQLIAMTMPRSNIRPCRTVSRRRGTAAAGSIFVTKRGVAGREFQDLLTRSKPDRDYLEISVLPCGATIRAASLFGVAISNGVNRSIPAPR